jgi:hypothetical protein
MSITPEYKTLGKLDHQAADLERIERHATHARNNAISVFGAVRLLRSQPAFETKAQDALKLSEVELETALEAVRKAMAEFSTKPVTA